MFCIFLLRIVHQDYDNSKKTYVHLEFRFWMEKETTIKSGNGDEPSASSWSKEQDNNESNELQIHIFQYCTKNLPQVTEVIHLT